MSIYVNILKQIKMSNFSVDSISAGVGNSPSYGINETTGNSFDIQCGESDFIDQVDIYNNNSKIKGMEVTCAKNKNKLYAGVPKQDNYQMTSIRCPEMGFSGMNIYETVDPIDTSKITGIDNVGLICSYEDSNKSKYATYEIDLSHAKNSLLKGYVVPNGNRINGFKGSYQNEDVNSLQVLYNQIPTKETNTNDTRNIIIIIAVISFLIIASIIIYIWQNSRVTDVTNIAI